MLDTVALLQGWSYSRLVSTAGQHGAYSGVGVQTVPIKKPQNVAEINISPQQVRASLPFGLRVILGRGSLVKSG